MAWWDGLDFNLGGGGGGFDTNWWNPGDFNLDFSVPAFNLPAFDFPEFNLGFDPSMFALPQMDPLALPTFDSFFAGRGGGQQADFSQFGVPPMELQGIGGPPSPDLGFGGTGAPQTALPTDTIPQTSDALVNLMGQQGGLGYDPNFGLDLESMFGGDGGTTGLPGASPYWSASEPTFNLGGTGPGVALGGSAYGVPGETLPSGRPMSEQEKFYADQRARMNRPTSGWDTAAKLAAAFGPAALGAAGLGLQAANRPERNPLEDELLRTRIASTGLQDTLAKDRLAFEKSNAEQMRAFQERMQGAMLESRKPGGQANIDALLQGNPQLASLYQALTGSTTGLASGQGSPEFNAMIEQIAQVDIGELRRQADQQKAQAMEMSNRQGVNPANIVAEIEQRFLQESAKARANARNVLIAQVQPGIQTFNSVGGLFGNLFQVPGA